MVERINRSVAVSSTIGSSEAAEDYVIVEAVDVLNVSIPVTTPTTVKVQPAGAGLVQSICIQSSRYSDLVFTVDLVATPITLSKMLELMGADQVALLGPTCKDLIFVNSGDAPVVVTIIVGRAAVDPGA